jgi:hypothetical protein
VLIPDFDRNGLGRTRSALLFCSPWYVVGGRRTQLHRPAALQAAIEWL